MSSPLSFCLTSRTTFLTRPLPFAGLMTVVTGPYIYWKLDNNPHEARFLTPEERLWAVERLRDNNAGAVSSQVNWNQVFEAMWSPVTWMVSPFE